MYACMHVHLYRRTLNQVIQQTAQVSFSTGSALSGMAPRPGFEPIGTTQPPPPPPQVMAAAAGPFSVVSECSCGSANPVISSASARMAAASPLGLEKVDSAQNLPTCMPACRTRWPLPLPRAPPRPQETPSLTSVSSKP